MRSRLAAGSLVLSLGAVAGCSGTDAEPIPSVTQASPQDWPDASSAQPNSTGLTTPAPKPMTERTA